MRVLLLAALVAGCTSTNGIDRDIEPHITITQGLYGQLTFVSDAGHVPPRVYPDTSATVYAAGTTTLVAGTTSDANGIYQLQLAAGSYTACTQGRTPANGIANPGGCLSITIGSGRVRQDWEATIDGGFWCTDGKCGN